MGNIKHAFTSALPDPSDPTLIKPTDWNADHVINETGVLIGDGTTLSGLASPGPLRYLRSATNAPSPQYEFAPSDALYTEDFNFSQLRSGTLPAGSTSLTLSPVPLGVNGSNTNHYLRIFSGSTSETVLITGGTAVSGAASGTVQFMATSQTYTGSYTVMSASAGITEACKFGAYSNIVVSAGNHFIYANVRIADGGLGGQALTLRGEGVIQSRLIRHSTYPNGDLITLAPSGFIFFRDISILNANGFANNTGAGLALRPSQPYSIVVERTDVFNGQTPILISPSAPPGTVYMRDVNVIEYPEYWTVYGCGDCIATYGSFYFDNVLVHIQGAVNTYPLPTTIGAAILITQSDGIWIVNCFLAGKDGIRIANDPAKILNFLYVSDTYFESCNRHGFVVEAGAHNAVFGSVRINDCHFTTQGGDPSGVGIFILNDLNGVVIANNNITGWASSGISLGAGSLSPTCCVVTGNLIANNARSGTGHGIVIASSAANLQHVICGNQIGNGITSYVAPNPSQQVGIYFAGATGKWAKCTVSGNTLFNNTVAPLLFDSGPIVDVVWTGNYGIDDNTTTTVASASSIALPIYPVFRLTGTTGVSTITGPLVEGRQLTMIPQGIVTFTAGATIGNTFTTTANVPVSLTVYAGKLYLR